MINKENEMFVLQDTQQLFNENPKFRKRINTITDKGAFIDKISEIPRVRAVANDLISNQINSFSLQNEMSKKNVNPLYQYR